LNEVHVETYGAMTKKEKAEFILEQIRLMLAKKDFVRASIVAKKLSPKSLNEEGFEAVKVKFYKLMVEYHTHENDMIELFRDFHAICNTKTIEEDEDAWNDAAKQAVIYLILSPHDNEQHDMLHRMFQNKKFENIPSYKELLKLFTVKELVQWPLPQHDELMAHVVLQGSEKLQKLLHKRTVEHNIRMVAGYYSRVRMPHLAKMVGLTDEETEKSVSELVCNGTIFARIDRPSGICNFAKPLPAAERMSNWAADISELLNLVEQNCHLINKENMLHKI